MATMHWRLALGTRFRVRRGMGRLMVVLCALVAGVSCGREPTPVAGVMGAEVAVVAHMPDVGRPLPEPLDVGPGDAATGDAGHGEDPVEDGVVATPEGDIGGDAGSLAPALVAEDVFDALRPDPPPRQLNRNSHFFLSDERHHEVYREFLTNRGGIMVGVGTDQNYTMAAWARPEWLVLMDFDWMIPDLHRLYRLAFLNAADAADFIAMWSEGDVRLTTLVTETVADEARRAAMLEVHRRARVLVHSRLRRLSLKMERAKVPHFLTDSEQFQWLVGMFRADRVVMVRGDLTGELTVPDISAAARKLGLPIRVLYVSNAEAYFGPYPPSWLRNVAELPMDAHSVVLRTVANNADWSPDKLYEYNIQAGPHFQAWVAGAKIERDSVKTLIRNRRIDKARQLSFLGEVAPMNVRR